MAIDEPGDHQPALRIDAVGAPYSSGSSARGPTQRMVAPAQTIAASAIGWNSPWPPSARQVASVEMLSMSFTAGAQPRTEGRSTPRSRAVSIARSYPASAWRMTPVPGSAVSTRSSLRSPASVPSATATIPA